MFDNIFYGFLNFSWWEYLLYLFITTQITIAGVTIFFHRYQAHRALELHPIISHFFRFWLWLATGMVTKEWASIHRKHHARCETADDPHSPQVLGLNTVMWYGTELYRKEAKNKETLERYGQGTPDDWIERNLYSKYTKLGILSFLVIQLLLLGVPGLAVWAIQMAWIPFFGAGLVNGVGHFWGYRSFECKDESKNICPLGIFIGGEELHNNHHTFPTSAKLSVKWWEFDWGWGLISLFSWFGLAKAKRVPPKVHLKSSKLDIDRETLTALVTNRFQIMAHYSKNVLLPTLQQEAENLRATNSAVWSRLKELLVKESSLLQPQAKEKLSHFLSNNASLSQVYEFKERLQHIWSQTQAKEKELIEALQAWCREAEATRVKALEEFSNYIKRLCLVTA